MAAATNPGADDIPSTANFAAPLVNAPHNGAGAVEAFENITVTQACINYSVEELRLNDYKRNRGKPTLAPNSMDNFCMKGNGLVHARVDCHAPSSRSARLPVSTIHVFGNDAIIVFDVGKYVYCPLECQAKIDEGRRVPWLMADDLLGDTCKLADTEGSSSVDTVDYALGEFCYHLQAIKASWATVLAFRGFYRNDKKKRFHIQETLVTSRSEFVRLALAKDWKESQERVIPFPEDDPAVFWLYQQWCYYTRIFSLDRTNNIYGESCSNSEVNFLVKAYHLGDKLLDTHFKDAVLDCIIAALRTTNKFDRRLTSLVYDNTPDQSPLRRLFQDIYMWAGDASWLDEQLVGDFVHAEFLLDLGKRYLNGQRPAQAPYLQASTCDYHEHVKGVCYLQAYQ